MEIIRSHQNAMVKNYQKLQTSKGRKKAEAYMIEGEHLVEEAIQSNILIQRLVVSEDTIHLYEKWTESYPTMIVSKEVFEKLSMTQTNQGILAIVPLEKKPLVEVPQGRYLLADAVQDPGNLGTIIRTADAFNFDCIILGKGTTSLYGQKVIRSTQGSNFHIDCFDNIDLVELIDEMHEFNIFATSLKADKYIEQLDNITGKVAVVFGNEGAGVSEEILSKVNNLFKISMPGRAESLNVSIAAGIVMHYISTNLK